MKTQLLSALLALAALPLSASPPQVSGTDVHFVQTDAGRIELHPDRGHCQSQAKRAAYVPVSGEQVAGCWITHGALVGIVFFDGDVAQVPIAMLKKAAAV